MTPYYRNEVRKMDDKLGLDEPAAYCAAMLLCAINHGAYTETVIDKTGVPAEVGNEIAERLRQQRIWVGPQTHHSGWDDPETGGIAFWMDVNVGLGFMERAKPKKKIRSSKIGSVANRGGVK